MTTPEIVELLDQPYVAIKASVTMRSIGEVLPPLAGEVFTWLDAHGAAAAGAPFFKYNVIDMERELEVEVGVPVAGAVAGDERVVSGVLPAGRYATLTHVGEYSGLYNATGRLLDWGKAKGLTWDMSLGDDGERWGARLEVYETDPESEPDPDRWVTRLVFRLADGA
jgi:effector-binding domain-containing protein